MGYLYKSITGRTVQVGSIAVTTTGIEFPNANEELDRLLGISLVRVYNEQIQTFDPENFANYKLNKIGQVSGFISPQGQVFTPSNHYSKDYNIGVFYFPGWSTPGGGPFPSNPWSVIPVARRPIYGSGTPDETSQDYCDYNLELMRDHGIKFVSILQYFQDGGSGSLAPFLNHFLDNYIKSKVYNKPKFNICFVAQTNAFLYTPSSWPGVYNSFLPYFRDPNYLFINNKPSVAVFDVPSFHTQMGSAAQVANSLNQARAAMSAEFGGIHFTGCTSAAGEFWANQVTTAGWDAVTSYTVFSKTEIFGDTEGSNLTGFSRLDDAVYGPNEVISTRNSHSWFGNAGYTNPPAFPSETLQLNGWCSRSPGILAPIMSGWDSRPWDNSNTLIAIPTDQQFENHLLKARSAIDAFRSKTQGYGIITAWNEFGEGQYIQPTVGGGMGKLLAIKRVFG